MSEYKIYIPINKNEFKSECCISYRISTIHYNDNFKSEELKSRKAYKRMQNYMYTYVHKSAVLDLKELEYECPHKFCDFMIYSSEDLDDVKDTTSEDVNVFLHACRFGYSRHIASLLEATYPEIYQLTSKGENGLHIATKHGNIKVVNQILKTNYMRFINSENSGGSSPYDYAVRKGDKELIEVYINYFKSLDPSVYQFQIPILERHYAKMKKENSFTYKLKKRLTNLTNKATNRY